MATAIAEPWLLDTNVLLEATDEARKHHDEARDLLESPRKLVCPAQVIREYLVVATRPVPASGLGLPAADALANVREIRRSVRLLPEEKPVLQAFLELVERIRPAGQRIHDAHLVATALVHAVPTIVSLSARDLTGFGTGLVVVSPAEALRAKPDRGSRR